MVETPPVLSIVSPVLNAEAHIASCLESVRRLAAAVPGAIEHVIADGGSTDRTLEITRRSAETEGSPVSRVLEGPDRGQSHAVNRAVAASRGGWIGWLNADDVYDARAERLVRDLAEGRQSDADVVVGRCRFVNGEGRVVFTPTPPSLDAPDDLLRPLSRWFAGRCIVQPEVFVRRSVFERVGGLDESNHLAMDHDLWLRLFEIGARFVSVGVPVAEQLAHAGQKTADNLGVARCVLENCEAFLRRRAGEPPAGVVEELAELRGRIEAVQRVLRSSRGRSPFEDGAVRASLRSAVGRIHQPRGGTLAVGGASWETLARAGWDMSRVVRSGSATGFVGAFDAAVADCRVMIGRREGADAVLRALRPGGTAVLGACSTLPGLERAAQPIRRALGDRVTWSRSPWSDELIGFAADLLGWMIARRGSASTGLVRPIAVEPIAVSASERRLLDHLGVRPEDAASTLVERQANSRGGVR